MSVSSLSAFSQIPIDWLIIAILFVIVAADALRAGSARACALALSFPLASLFFQMIPQTVVLGTIAQQFPSAIEQAVLFAILEVLLFVCLNQMLYSFERSSSLLSATVSGLAATIVVLVVWTQTPVLQSVWHFDPQIQAIFGQPYEFLWLLGSYLALAFVGG